jgi:hypothetical protein
MKPCHLWLWFGAVLCSALGCKNEQSTQPTPQNQEQAPSSQTLSAEQKRVVGTWHLRKSWERGTVYRELLFHPDAVHFSTTCQSISPEVTANGQGVGTWTVSNGIIRAEWVERAVVPSGAVERSYTLDLKIQDEDGETQLVVPDNLDCYRKKP